MMAAKVKKAVATLTLSKDDISNYKLKSVHSTLSNFGAAADGGFTPT